MVKPLLSPAMAPPATPQRIGGLLAAAQPGDPNARWTAGVTVWHEPPPAWRLVADCTPEAVELGESHDPRPTAAVPFLIQTSVEQPAPELDQMADRARHRLEAVTSRAIARELWSGELTRAAPYSLSERWDWTNPAGSAAGTRTNPYLAAGGTQLVAESDLLDAVAAVEQAVADRTLVGAPHVHVPLVAMPALQHYLVPVGDLLTTPSGSVVVADYGYPATADPAVIYGTGPVSVWFGGIDVHDDPGEVVRTTDNRVQVWAERPALVMFDPDSLVSCQVSP